MAVAPDGRAVLYQSAEGFYVQRLDALDARLVPGTEGVLNNPFFSADGRFIGYWNSVTRTLMKVDLDGNAPVAIAATANPRGASWAVDGTIYFGASEGIMRVPASGGMPELVIKARDGETVYGPQLLPGGDAVLFSITTATGETRWDQGTIVADSLRTGARTVILEGGSDARYIRTGHLVYARGTALLAVPFDLSRLEVSGGPVSLIDGLYRADLPAVNTAAANYAVSDNGTLVYVTGNSPGQHGLVWVDRQGHEEFLPAPPRLYIYPRISPDGTRVALRIRDQQRDIWMWDSAPR
jgi:serine/threonine-protein kinase